MAMRDLKGWNLKTHRWRWLIKGEPVCVTCAQLGLPEDQWTYEGSVKAAYEWKMKFKGQQAVERAKLHPHAEHLERLTERFQIASDLGLDTGEIQAEINETKALPAEEDAYIDQATGDKIQFARLQGLNVDGLDPSLLKRLFGSDELWADRKKRSGRVEIGKTIGEASKRYLAGKQEESRAGIRSADGADNIRRWLGKFVAFAGELTAIDAISFDFWERWKLACKAKSTRTQTPEAKDEYAVSKAFVRYLWKQELLTLPRNFDDKIGFTQWTKEIAVYEIPDIKKTLALAPGQLKLHVLLMLNCGMTQKDISDLLKSQIDMKAGTITRKRSKTEFKKGTPLVSYPLWSSTLTELKKHLSPHPSLALTTKTGQAWVRKATRADGMLSKADNIATNWRNMKNAHPEATFLKTLISLKKSSSSLLRNSDKYAEFYEYFIGHSDKTTGAKSYGKLDKKKFNQAVAWLAQKYGQK